MDCYRNPTTEAGHTRHTNRTIRNAERYVRTVARSVAVFVTAIQTGQTLFQVWDWTNNIGVLW